MTHNLSSMPLVHIVAFSTLKAPNAAGLVKRPCSDLVSGRLKY